LIGVSVIVAEHTFIVLDIDIMRSFAVKWTRTSTSYCTPTLFIRPTGAEGVFDALYGIRAIPSVANKIHVTWAVIVSTRLAASIVIGVTIVQATVCSSKAMAACPVLTAVDDIATAVDATASPKWRIDRETSRCSCCG
jgi:hypothetical protein